MRQDVLAPRWHPRSDRGLRIPDSPNSDNLTPQKTIKQIPGEVGPDGADFSCPCSITL